VAPAQASPGLNGRLSLSSNRAGTASSGDIFVTPVGGAPVRRLTDAPADDAQSAWSPDGRRIAFKSRRDGNNELYVMKYDGTGQTRLTSSPTVSEGQPAWSPNGKRLLYRKTQDNPIVQNADIWQVEVDPRKPNPRPVLERPGDERYPSYSPDGTKIVFRGDTDAIDHSGDEELYVMDADGSRVVQLTANAVFDSAPVFSPDGTKIAFESARDSGDPLALDIYVMNADGSGVRRLTDNPAHDEGPAWSPDGTKIAFATERDSQEEIYVMNADGTQPRSVTVDPSRDESPDWQPLPLTMAARDACGDVSLDSGGASSIVARGVSCARALGLAKDWAQRAVQRKSRSRLNGFTCKSARHTYDMVIVRCRSDARPAPASGAPEVAFVWRDPSRAMARSARPFGRAPGS
jgi:Tol biopolymer transport system component